jgi:hypothetical protein
MKRGKALAKLLVLTIGFSAAGTVQAGQIVQTLGGSAGFADGSTTARVGTWNTATAGNAAPFNAYLGSNVSGPNFSTSWQFSYGNLTDTIVSATLALGIYDIDSAAAPHNQVASYTEGSNDLTALLQNVSQGLHSSTGAVRNEYDILTITLPGSTFADLALGNPSFALQLQGPGLGALGNTTFDGAGIDFSTITIDTQPVLPTPEPAAWQLLAAGIAGLAGRKWLRKT